MQEIARLGGEVSSLRRAEARLKSDLAFAEDRLAEAQQEISMLRQQVCLHGTGYWVSIPATVIVYTCNQLMSVTVQRPERQKLLSTFVGCLVGQDLHDCSDVFTLH